jgi:hypothetical protein
VIGATEKSCAYMSARNAAVAGHEVFQRLVGVPIAQREGMVSSNCSKVLCVVLVVHDRFWDISFRGNTYVSSSIFLLPVCSSNGSIVLRPGIVYLQDQKRKVNSFRVRALRAINWPIASGSGSTFRNFTLLRFGCETAGSMSRTLHQGTQSIDRWFGLWYPNLLVIGSVRSCPGVSLGGLQRDRDENLEVLENLK